jgi:recombinational DNA repair ATPase RecF
MKNREEMFNLDYLIRTDPAERRKFIDGQVYDISPYQPGVIVKSEGIVESSVLMG